MSEVGERSRVVVDTNVLVVANGHATHASMTDRAACARRLQQARDTDCVVIDDAYQVILEYQKYANHSGQPGVGDHFLRWTLQRIATDSVLSVHIPSEISEQLEALPDYLSTFDKADLKWLLLFLESDADAILNAADSDYAEAAEALLKAQIVVEEICPELAARKAGG